eukprot:4732514-Pyramimonas_sp.AAC.1
MDVDAKLDTERKMHQAEGRDIGAVMPSTAQATSTPRSRDGNRAQNAQALTMRYQDAVLYMAKRRR